MVALRQVRLVMALLVDFLEVEAHAVGIDPVVLVGSHREGMGRHVDGNLVLEEETSLVEHHMASVETHLGREDQAFHHDPNQWVVVGRMGEGIDYVDRKGGQEDQEDLAVVEEEEGQLGFDFGLEVGNLGAGPEVEGENRSIEAIDQHWNSHKCPY